MASKLLPGCATPLDADRKAMYQQLVEIFSPVVFFDPQERFFPVDLLTAVAKSSLYRVIGEPDGGTATLVQDRDAVPPLVPADLKGRDEHFFTAAADFRSVKKSPKGAAPRPLPTPSIDIVYERYSSGAIPATLTMYASVCSVSNVPNYQFVGAFPPAIGSLSEAILLNYYFYFPALETPGYRREGDWAGISLLFPRMPNVNPPFDPKEFEKSLGDMKILACYFRKARDESTGKWKFHDQFVAGPDGFRTWDKIHKRSGPSMTLETHPEVFISLGLHNCYYEPIPAGTLAPLPYNSTDPAKIEGGKYAPWGPSLISMHGPPAPHDDDWELPLWLAAAFPFLILTKMCAEATRVRTYGTATTPPGRPETAREGGYVGSPAVAGSGLLPSDRYPAPGPVPIFGPQDVTLRLEYVDLHDPKVDAVWQYAGSWGAAEYHGDTEPGGSVPTPPKTRDWGKFGGCERPILAQWFLWNLYWDLTFGCGGGDGFI